MQTLTIPLSGHLLVSHLAAYGLGFTLDAGGDDAFVGHDPLSLEMEPQVSTPASMERVGELIRQSAATSESAVEADLEPGQTGNDRQPVIWARATKASRAALALPRREELLDSAERGGLRITAGLLVGLGVPAAWCEDPQRGASRLDGVAGNYPSDFVRGVLRRVISAAASVEADTLEPIWTAARQGLTNGEDKTGWAPPGARVDLLHQWLAALGLSLLPVGQSANGRGKTPCYWRDGRLQGVTLPVFEAPVSVPRLRGLLQRPELLVRPDRLTASAKAGLRALGIPELVTFLRVDRSTKQMTTFFFGRGTRIDL